MRYGDSAPADRVAEHVRDVMRGPSLDKTFGVAAGPQKQKPFDPASLYTSRAERLGGRPVPAETAEAATGFMRKHLGMRAVQFGNTVPDRREPGT